MFGWGLSQLLYQANWPWLQQSFWPIAVLSVSYLDLQWRLVEVYTFSFLGYPPGGLKPNAWPHLLLTNQIVRYNVLTELSIPILIQNIPIRPDLCLFLQDCLFDGSNMCLVSEWQCGHCNQQWLTLATSQPWIYSSVYSFRVMTSCRLWSTGGCWLSCHFQHVSVSLALYSHFPNGALEETLSGWCSQEMSAVAH